MVNPRDFFKRSHEILEYIWLYSLTVLLPRKERERERTSGTCSTLLRKHESWRPRGLLSARHSTRVFLQLLTSSSHTAHVNQQSPIFQHQLLITKTTWSDWNELSRKPQNNIFFMQNKVKEEWNVIDDVSADSGAQEPRVEIKETKGTCVWLIAVPVALG